MKTTNTHLDPRNTPTAHDGTKNESPQALSAVCVNNQRGGAPLSLVKKLREAELLALLTNPDVSRGKKIAEITRLDDIETLILIATGDTPTYLRKNALLRIDEICDGQALDRKLVTRLVPCLNEKELLTVTITLMDMSDFDWCPHCNEATVDALCGALYECQVMHESVILEDMFTHLAHRRYDLYHSLRACDPGKFLMRTGYAPVTTNNIIFPDLPKKDNVA